MKSDGGRMSMIAGLEDRIEELWRRKTDLLRQMHDVAIEIEGLEYDLDRALEEIPEGLKNELDTDQGRE